MRPAEEWCRRAGAAQSRPQICGRVEGCESRRATASRLVSSTRLSTREMQSASAGKGCARVLPPRRLAEAFPLDVLGRHAAQHRLVCAPSRLPVLLTSFFSCRALELHEALPRFLKKKNKACEQPSPGRTWENFMGRSTPVRGRRCGAWDQRAVSSFAWQRRPRPPGAACGPPAVRPAAAGSTVPDVVVHR